MDRERRKADAKKCEASPKAVLTTGVMHSMEDQLRKDDLCSRQNKKLIFEFT